MNGVTGQLDGGVYFVIIPNKKEGRFPSASLGYNR
jgi:hypothetical protein